MRNLYAILCAIVLMFATSCAEDRAQIASDSRAGIRAVIQAQETGEATDQLAILRGVDARLPAVAEVNSAEWPAPKMTIPQVIEKPREYFISAPPEPSRAGAIATIIAVSVAGLGLLRIVAPLIPGGGPVIKTVADLAWKFLADKEQKKADAEQARLAEIAKKLPAQA